MLNFFLDVFLLVWGGVRRTFLFGGGGVGGGREGRWGLEASPGYCS